MRTEILYEDEHIIVTRKPAGLAVQTAKVGQADMVSELRNHLQGAYLGVVHRLDQPVEGVLAFGKTKAATADLSRQLAQGLLHKKYFAAVCGQPAAAEGELTDYLYKTPDGRAEVAGAERKNAAEAKKAVLKYKILTDCRVDLREECGTAENDRSVTIYLADISIETGRFHQIRAQMAHAGMPLLGDVKYGTEESRNLSGALHVRNVALCAYEVCFTHPASHRQMEFRIQPGEEIFRKFLAELPK